MNKKTTFLILKKPGTPATEKYVPKRQDRSADMSIGDPDLLKSHTVRTRVPIETKSDSNTKKKR